MVNKYGEWDFIADGTFDPCNYIYIDFNRDPITGIIENFYFSASGDPRNNIEVIDGKKPK